MADGLKPYPQYKSSGLPWLERIPAHWEVRRNGRLFSQRNETGFPELPILEVSLKTGVRIRDVANGERKQMMADRAKYKRAVRGDIAYNMMRLWQGAVGVAPVDGLVSPAYVVARPYADLDSRYYAYLFRTAVYMNEVNKYSHGIVSDRNRLYWDEFKQMPSIFPPAAEQKAVAAYLDNQGALVARFIRNRRRLIDLLNQQKQAIMHRAVTRGMNPTARMKLIRIGTVDEAPAHWELRRLKSVAEIRYGLGQPPRELPNGLPLIRATNVDHGRIVEKDLVFIDPAAVPPTRGAFLSAGEIIVVRSGAYTADSAIIPQKFEGAVAGYDMVVTVRKALPEFIALCILSSYVRVDQLLLASSRAAQPHLNAEELGTCIVLLPPLDEQREIVESVRQNLEVVEREISRAHKQVSLIREYQARLISEVVTGKIDVRDAQFDRQLSPESEVASEPDALSEEITPADELAEEVAIGDE